MTGDSAMQRLCTFCKESSRGTYAGVSVGIGSAYQDLLLLDVVLEELLGLRFADHYCVHGLQVARVGGQRYSNLKQHSNKVVAFKLRHVIEQVTMISKMRNIPP
jgi:hypothetical protein